jgi:hypothetical protein
MSTLLHISLIPKGYNSLSTHQLQRSASVHYYTCMSHSQKTKKPSTYKLQRNATEHSSTCKSHSHKPQPAPYLSDTEERYGALFCM